MPYLNSHPSVWCTRDGKKRHRVPRKIQDRDSRFRRSYSSAVVSLPFPYPCARSPGRAGVFESVFAHSLTKLPRNASRKRAPQARCLSPRAAVSSTMTRDCDCTVRNDPSFSAPGEKFSRICSRCCSELYLLSRTDRLVQY